MTAKNVTVMNLIDLKEVHDCKVKINAHEYFVVCLITKNEKRYAMLAGGRLIEVTQETFDKLKIVLDEHFRKHIFKK